MVESLETYVALRAERSQSVVHGQNAPSVRYRPMPTLAGGEIRDGLEIPLDELKVAPVSG